MDHFAKVVDFQPLTYICTKCKGTFKEGPHINSLCSDCGMLRTSKFVKGAGLQHAGRIPDREERRTKAFNRIAKALESIGNPRGKCTRKRKRMRRC